jgi:hypothetical protein
MKLNSVRRSPVNDGVDRVIMGLCWSPDNHGILPVVKAGKGGSNTHTFKRNFHPDYLDENYSNTHHSMIQKTAINY